MTLWITLGEAAKKEYDRLHPGDCRECYGSVGQHNWNCSVRIRREAEDLRIANPSLSTEELIDFAEAGAIEWADAWDDPWTWEARMLRMIADHYRTTQEKV